MKGYINKDVYNLGSNYQLPFQENLSQIMQNSQGMYPQYEITARSADLMRRGTLNYFDNRLANNLQSTNEFMRHAIEGLRDIPNTANCQLIRNPEIRLLDILKDKNLVDFIRYNNYGNFPGIEYDSNSRVARQIVNSQELQRFIGDNYQKLLKGGIKLSSIAFKDPDLYKSLHNSWIFNAYIDKDGNFSAIMYDKYDFELILKDGFTEADVAAILQNIHSIQNYFVIIHIKIPKNELRKIIK